MIYCCWCMNIVIRFQEIINIPDKIELVRLLLRVLKDLKQLSLKRFTQISVLTENISKQLTGWKKSLK